MAQASKTTRTTNQPQENGLAIASLVLGIISFTFALGPIAGIPAVITGVMSLKNPRNKNLGIIGIVLGSISSLIGFVIIGLIFLAIIVALLNFAGAPHHTPSNTDSAPFSDFQVESSVRPLK